MEEHPIQITADPRKSASARAIPGAFRHSELGWAISSTADRDHLRLALRLFPEMWDRISEDLAEDLATGDTAPRPFDEATPWLGARDGRDLLTNVPAELRDALYDYQATDVAYIVERMRNDGSGYLAWDRGLGKTLGALTVAAELQAARLIIVCPNSSKATVWAPEINKWLSDVYDPEHVYNCGGTAKQRNRVLAKWVADGGVLLIHYEALRLIDWRSMPTADLVVVDEAHRLARGSASASAPIFFKALKKVPTRFKLALSGSLISNSPEDFFGANHWLYPTIYRSQYRDWRDKYLRYVDGPFGRVLVGVRQDRIEEMRAELGLFTVVRRKQDELKGLPERIEQTIRVEMTPSQRRVYEDLAQNFIATLDSGETITAGSALAQLTQLRKVATGLDLVAGGFSDSSKLDVAEQLVVDADGKVVIFAWHKASVYAMQERLQAKGITADAITGDTPMATRAEIVEAFQTRDDPRVLVATIKTLGESVTLHRARDLIFLESSWTPTDMEQAADRVYRIGQTGSVTITHLVTANTVDETAILPRVNDKAAMRRLVLGGD